MMTISFYIITGFALLISIQLVRYQMETNRRRREQLKLKKHLTPALSPLLADSQRGEGETTSA